MHPNQKFAWTETDELLAFVQQRGFSIIVAMIDDQPRIAHGPVVVHRTPDRLHFHLAIANALTKQIDGKKVTVVTTAFDGYISPDWYVSDNQVPTWNYLSVETDGIARMMSKPELTAQLDNLSAEHEGQIDGKTPWTRDKMTDAAFAAMLNGIVGFELMISMVRGTAKLSQNKATADFQGAVDGLAPHNPALALLMQNWRARS